MKQIVEQLVFSLGRNVPVEMDNQALQFIEMLNNKSDILPTVYQKIYRQKVILQAYHNLSLLQETNNYLFLSQLKQKLQEGYERRIAFATNTVPMLKQEIISLLEGAQIPFFFIKGSSFETYPHAFVRQMNDIDFMVENWSDCFIAGRLLVQNGYSHREALDEVPWIARMPLNAERFEEEMVGHLNLVRWVGNRNVSLDLHTSPFTVGPTGSLVCSMWQRIESNLSHIPTPEDQMLILVAHAANHGCVLIKDLNDIYAIVNRYANIFDWHYFVQSVQESMLSDTAHYALNKVKHSYPGEYIPEAIIRYLVPDTEKVYTSLMSFTSEKCDEQRVFAERAVQSLHTFLFEKRERDILTGLLRAGNYLIWAWRMSFLQGKWGNRKWIRSLFSSKKHMLFPEPRQGEQIILFSILDICDSLEEAEVEQILIAVPFLFDQQYENLLKAAGLTIKVVGKDLFFISKGEVEALVSPLDIFVPSMDTAFGEEKIVALEALIQTLGQIISATTD